MNNHEYVQIPISWLETLEKLANNTEIALTANVPDLLPANILLGYISSVKTIIKYNQKS